MKKRIIIAIFILALLLPTCFHTLLVQADNGVSLKVSFKGFDVDGKTFADHRGEFQAIYRIEKGDAKMLEIGFEETLEDKDGNRVGRPNIRLIEGISQEGVVEFYGEKYQLSKEKAPYTLRYVVKYRTEGSDRWTTLADSQRAVHVLNIDLDVQYQAEPQTVKEGEEVLYTATVESKSNVTLYNIFVKDSELGDLGVIPVLQPGQKAEVSKSFVVVETTKSHAVVAFDDPLGIKGSLTENSGPVQVEVERLEAVASFDLKGTVDKVYLPIAGEVTFTLEIRNQGNVPLTDIQCIDWEENVFHTIKVLEPGARETVSYHRTVEPGNSYTITARATVQGSGQKIQEVFSQKFIKLEPKVEVDRVLVPEKVKAGEKLVIEYTLRNTGTVLLKNIKVSEPEFGDIVSIERLEPNEERKFSIERTLSQQSISKTIVTAIEDALGSEYQYEASELVIPVEIPPGTPHISFTVTSTPEKLEEAGEVEIKCILKNDGDGTLTNVEVTLVERQLMMGSILTFKPGQEQVLTIPSLGLQKTETFTIRARGKDQDNNWVEFTSNPFEIKVGSEPDLELDLEDPGEETSADDIIPEVVEDRKLALIRSILIGLGALVVLTAAALIYFIKKIS